MTKAQITQVSRNWVGHIATNPKARDAMNAARGDHEKMAGLINKYVDPKAPVMATDVPKIQQSVDEMFTPENQAAMPVHLHALQIGKG